MKSLGSFFLLILCVWLGGCQSDEDLRTSDNTGFLVTLTDELEQAYTRATPAELGKPIKEQFKLLVVDTATGKETYSGQCSESVLVKAGLYNLTATFGDNPIIALDAPYYEGKLEGQEVKTGEMTSVEIPCSVANALLSVSFNHESLKKAFENYYVTVSVNDQAVEIDSTGRKSAYFRAGSSPSLKFHAYLAGTGKEFAYELPAEKIPTNIKAGHHIRVNLTVTGVASGVGISVDKVTNEPVSVLETIPGEWLPAPKISATGFDTSTKTLEVYETEAQSASIDFAISSPLQELEFSLNFKDENLSSLNGDYVLSELPDEKRIEFENKGINLPMIGYNKPSITLSETLTQALHSKNDEVVANEIIIKSVKANDRVNKEGIVTYTINTHKPEFTITALPGDIWTKEFTVSALKEDQVVHGDFSELSKNMKYQFSLDGNSGWTDLAEDLRKDGLQPGTTYYVRGVYRGEICGTVKAIKTYDALSIPNSNLDEGYDTSYPKKNNPLYTFKGGWIGTRNPLTCHNQGVNAFYVSKSSTLPLNDNGSTVAHMMTIGWGKGNTCVDYKAGSVINHISAGIVCVGDYDAGTDMINAKEAAIRPTTLSFIYKASPYNGDEYLVKAELVNITDGVETIIGTGNLQSGITVSNYTTQTINIEYADAYKELPITHVRVVFKAGTKEDRDHLEDKFRDASIWEGYVNAYIIGSQFWLDSFSFNYDK